MNSVVLFRCHMNETQAEVQQAPWMCKYPILCSGKCIHFDGKINSEGSMTKAAQSPNDQLSGYHGDEKICLVLCVRRQ